MVGRWVGGQEGGWLVGLLVSWLASLCNKAIFPICLMTQITIKNLYYFVHMYLGNKQSVL